MFTPLATLVLVPDTQSLSFVHIPANMDACSHGSSATMRWLVFRITGSPEPAPAFTGHNDETPNTRLKRSVEQLNGCSIDSMNG